MNSANTESSPLDGSRRRLDEYCKQILANKYILAYILADCAEEFKNHSIEDIACKYIEGTPEISRVPVNQDPPPEIRGLNGELSSVNEGTVRFDIYFRATVPMSGVYISLYINIESQMDFRPGYPILKRGVYYTARMLSSQHGKEFTKSDYGKLKKVYSIWICTDPPKKYANSIAVYHMAQRSLIGHIDEPKESYDLMQMVLVCLGEPETAKCNTLELLGELLIKKTSSKDKRAFLKNKFDIPITDELERSITDMSGLADFYERKGELIGERKGERKGKEQGMLESISLIMKNANYTVQQAMDLLEIPKDKQAKYKEMLGHAD